MPLRIFFASQYPRCLYPVQASPGLCCKRFQWYPQIIAPAVAAAPTPTCAHKGDSPIRDSVMSKRVMTLTLVKLRLENPERRGTLYTTTTARVCCVLWHFLVKYTVYCSEEERERGREKSAARCGEKYCTDAG